ncbi:helix-turn-helix domain-containing protein [Lonepinella koalarum]|uniref:Helix-turn-helix protein n=1 Tax=Lonepinella koalarum TaxID=53417 RepID=A0A4R1KJJ6_9PAST|nr:helix-turn-helix transcriptional regulator [Lonepinella koalarum]MDH2927335.1 DNA-binding protein [Lonepinella koalarum]TCK64935.1 helix-turn-helix protein [Lonepinella koalarum]TFJ88809.1 XRE family transcriptional regulator [Lonepinella koalarum]
MALTEFGKAVRKARIDANETLLSMAKKIGTSPAFLSGMETGRKKISNEWIEKVVAFFNEKKVKIENLSELAHISNATIPVEGLPLKQQMLVAGFAKSAMTAEQLKKFANFLEEINHQKENN